MDFATLALIALVALLGPLVAIPAHLHLPVVLGELAAGIVLGTSGTGWLHPSDATFTLLADVGFALVMFVAGTKVPVRDARLRASLGVGALRAIAVGVVAVAAAIAISHAFGTGHAALYAVLLASSSAALILPIVDSLDLGGQAVLGMLPQVAIADAACIVALPLAIDPAHAARAALGAAALLGCCGALFVLLDWLERTGRRRRLHDLSERRLFALELRINLLVLFALSALAVATHVSIMLAGFAYGIVVAAVGPPRRLAKQLFAVTEGLFGPIFFVWLGASLDLRALGDHPSFIALGAVLGVAAILTHVAMRLGGQPVRIGLLAAAQLGVPVAAATLGTQLHLLRDGEPAALILGALITIGAAVAGGALCARAAT